jgi:hypothetical protein
MAQGSLPARLQRSKPTTNSAKSGEGPFFDLAAAAGRWSHLQVLLLLRLSWLACLFAFRRLIRPYLQALRATGPACAAHVGRDASKALRAWLAADGAFLRQLGHLRSRGRGGVIRMVSRIQYCIGRGDSCAAPG